MMLHIGAGHSNNCQIILKVFGYHIFCNNLLHKKFQANLEVSDVFITYVTNKSFDKQRQLLSLTINHLANRVFL